MDKDRKIQRYRQKDYTQVVTFPVEIIGRDGVVRHYSFEESIRLYQRRIASADLRYREPEIVEAEKQHCLNRIEQLRRSFFAHYGWAAIQLVDADGADKSALSAEVAAFLRRCLSNVHVQVEQFNFSHIDSSEHYRTYFVQPPPEFNATHGGRDGHFLLYMFTFQSDGPCAHRESFFDIIKLLQSLKLTKQGSTESLIAFFHTHDCGLILTGHGEVTASVETQQEIGDLELSWPSDVRPDPVSLAMRRLSQGRFDDALELFVQGYKEHHFRRVAYLGAAVVADQQGDDLEAETATVMGCSYFPGDPALIYHRAVNLLRNGRYTQARSMLDRVDSWTVGRGAAHFVRSLTLLAGGDEKGGQHHLSQALQEKFKLDPHLQQATRWCQSQLWARRVLTCCTWAIATLFGILAVVEMSAAYLIGVALFALLDRAIRKTWKRQLLLRIQGPTKLRLRLSSTSLLMSDIQEDGLQ